MRKRLYEIMGVPPQYHEDGPPEYPAPPDEFNRFAPQEEQESERTRSRIMRIMLLFGFAGLSAVGMLFARASATADDTRPAVLTASAVSTQTPEPEAAAVAVAHVSMETTLPEETSAPTAAPSDTPAPVPTDTPSPEPMETPSPEPAETPSPEPTETPAPRETPAIDALYFNFSAQYHLDLSLADAAELTACEIVITDPLLGNELFRHALTEAELAAGRYEMEPIWLDSYMMEHWSEFESLNAEPDPVLSVTAVYSTADGEKVLTKEQYSSYETGWYAQYDAPDAEANAYTFPGCLHFGTYEQYGKGPIVAVDDLSVIPFGGISISVDIDGVQIPADSCTVKERALTIFDEETGYYMTDVIIPIPENAPEHGTAHFVITQKITGYGRTVTFERDVDY